MRIITGLVGSFGVWSKMTLPQLFPQPSPAPSLPKNHHLLFKSPTRLSPTSSILGTFCLFFICADVSSNKQASHLTSRSNSFAAFMLLPSCGPSFATSTSTRLPFFHILLRPSSYGTLSMKPSNLWMLTLLPRPSLWEGSLKGLIIQSITWRRKLDPRVSGLARLLDLDHEFSWLLVSPRISPGTLLKSAHLC